MSRPSPPPSTISIVIPIHNEAAYLPVAVPEIFAELASVPADIDVTLAENGSSDDTAARVAALQESYPGLSLLRLPEPDYGAAMRAGLIAAGGEWRVNFDIDYFSGAFLKDVLRIGDEADVILASKRAPGADDQRPAIRRFATWVFNQLLRGLFNSRVSDTHGMKAIRAEVIDQIAPAVQSTQDLFDTELVLRAERAGYRIREVPAVVRERRETSQGLARRVPRTLLGLLKIRINLFRERIRS